MHSLFQKKKGRSSPNLILRIYANYAEKVALQMDGGHHLRTTMYLLMDIPVIYHETFLSMTFILAGLLKHRQRHHPDFTYLCHFCEKQFGVRNDLVRHMEKHTKGKWLSIGTAHTDMVVLILIWLVLHGIINVFTFNFVTRQVTIR